MALKKDDLQKAIKEAFEKAKKTEPPQDPKDTDKVQNQILNQLSLDLAEAIDAFVKSGEVKGITTEVKDNNNVMIGTGIQKETVKIT